MNNENKQAAFIRPEIETRIDRLLAQMTLLEKVGQLTQLVPDLVGGMDYNPETDASHRSREALTEDRIKEGTVGSFLGVQGAAEINRLQKIAVEESRLGIPLIFGLDVIHGFRTIFPIPLAETCGWDPEMARQTAEVAALEASAAGIHWTFAPMVDIARDARWGRIAESAGEDPFLGSVFAAARVRGFQGDDLADPDHLAACAKHFIAYGAAEGGRDYNAVEMAAQTLHEVYLPPFEAAAQAGAATFMSAFNTLNGVPTSANPYTLTTVLRDQLGFNGFVVSDWNSIGELVPHGFAANRKEAGKVALLAGVDMDMCTESYRYDVCELAETGVIPMDAIDQAVRRILRVKFLLGLFDNPCGRSTPEKEAATQMRPPHLALAREAARRSIVLLKNAGQTLPISAGEKTIAVVGPLADDQTAMLGSWAFTGAAKDVITPLEGIRAAAEKTSTRVLFSQGCQVSGEDDRSGFAEAVQAASQADLVIAVVGETAGMSGEAGSRLELGLPGLQEELLRALAETGKPLVVVLINGRPLAIPGVAENAAAVVEAWQLGHQAGNAIADVLFGDYNPSGRLSCSFPYAVGQSPVYYNHTRTGRPAGEHKFTSKYIDGPVEPLYPFGYGLSYTSFAYSDLKVTPQVVGPDGCILVSARVTNTGSRAGEEVVQLYISDLFASRVRPVKELKGFRKITLQPGESQEVRFELAAADLGFYNSEMQRVVEPGAFNIWVGPHAREGLQATFELVSG